MNSRLFLSILSSFFCALACLSTLSGQNIILPTANDALFRGQPEKFYMYVDRFFEGKASRPWQAGAYGFCRNPKRINGKIVYARFHEGIDISPVKRNAQGVPQDMVHSIASGKVVHVNADPKKSNYGSYIVVEHIWDGSPYYALYSHMMDTRVEVGDKLEQGDPLGRLGWTGVGLNMRRAHLHLELNLRLSDQFQSWFDQKYSTTNHHSIYNGMNLLGIDLGQFFLDKRKNKELTIPEFLATHAEAYWQVIVPSSGKELALVRRYPWLRAGNEVEKANSWRITFSANGLPLRVEPEKRLVERPKLARVRPSEVDHRHLTRGHLTGIGSRARLTQNGKNFLDLILIDEQ